MPVPRNTWLVAGLLAAALGLGYANSLRGPLIFDDEYSIADNPSLRQLWPLSVPLSPPVSSFTAGRPLLNLSFALNHAISGQNVGSYHAVNLLIHLAAALLLFGLVRRTLALPRVNWPAGIETTWVAFTVAAVWSLHPLLTGSVTYLSQRAESLMGLCYLATLYGVLRGATAARRAGWWYGGAILSCAAGMAVKEVMVTAPLLVLVFDRAFLTTSFREIARRRGAVYAGLAATWVVLAWLMIDSGFGEHGVGFQGAFTPGSYLLAESQIIARYLKLAIWPHPLVFDYGPEIGRNATWASLVPSLLLVGALLVASVVLAWRGRAAGFLGLGFFILLAPTSSVVPVQLQPMAENRLYLPLIPLSALFVLSLYRSWPRAAPAVAVTVALVFGVLTHSRNEDYASAYRIWDDTVQKNPRNSRAHFNLAMACLAEGREPAEAVDHFEEALALNPDYVEAHTNLANVLASQQGREAEARLHYEATLRLKPGDAFTQSNFAALLARLPGQQANAIAHYQAALELNPRLPRTHGNFANLLATLSGREAEAARHFEAALELAPDVPELHAGYASLLARPGGDRAQAEAHYLSALQLRPNYANAHLRLADLLAAQPDRTADTIVHYTLALALRPDLAEAARKLEAQLAALDGQPSLAASCLEQVLQNLPPVPPAGLIHYHLALALEKIPGRQAEARAHLEAAVRLNPSFTPASRALERFNREKRARLRHPLLDAGIVTGSPAVAASTSLWESKSAFAEPTAENFLSAPERKSVPEVGVEPTRL